MTGDLSGKVPVMVRAAHIAARRLGYEQSCIDEVGQLLQVLASQFPGETIAEIGGGCGVGTAWLASGLAAGAKLITVDNNEAAVESARSQLHDHVDVEILLGDWQMILQRGPFAMLFVDVSEAKARYIDEVIDALRPGGIAVLDDLTPLDQWPESWHDQTDTLRRTWLEHPRLRSVEVLVTPRDSVILATRSR